VSARPDVPRLAEEDLDLLISRSLDGDLSPEEEQQLERLVALDPAAARRKAELAALVADVKALPEPATPFALATRVNANVTERAGRPGSLGSRVGFFPAPGFAKAAMVILAIVGASIAILRPAPKRQAEGPVDVYLYNPARPASPAPQALIAEAKPAPLPQEKARRQESDALSKKGKTEGRSEEIVAGETSGKKALDRLEPAPANAPAEAAASNVVAGSALKANADRDEGAVPGGAVVLQAPAKIAAPAPPAAAARAMSAPAPHGWTVSVRGDAARRWSLRRAPDRTPAPGRTTVYAVTLDASGRVASARAVGGSAADPGLDEFVRGMVFEPLPQAAGALGDRKDAAAGPPAPAEFEIELAPR
jgi:hypothetical protein